jgi:hypothetical protein
MNDMNKKKVICIFDLISLISHRYILIMVKSWYTYIISEGKAAGNEDYGKRNLNKINVFLTLRLSHTYAYILDTSIRFYPPLNPDLNCKISMPLSTRLVSYIGYMPACKTYNACRLLLKFYKILIHNSLTDCFVIFVIMK